MRLELNIINIKDVKFGEKTAISDSILSINRRELQQLLQQDKRFGRVDIELAQPGDKCRILQVSDVIEPRAKITGNCKDFPGALSEQGNVGEGTTCVLRGVAIVMNDQSELTFPLTDQIGNLIDMSGPGAEHTVYANTQNVVVIPFPADGISPDDYRLALKIAGLKTAVYLAQAGKELSPDEVEVYALPPLAGITKGMEDLPKVAYIFQLYMNQFPPLAGEPILYGDKIATLIPTIIHPNEVFDGAIVNAYRGGVNETYSIQNHPVIKELYRRHGNELCFVGVILTISHSTEVEIERTAVKAASLAKSVLGADGVILTKSGGGAPEFDIAQTADRCEEFGVKTVLIMWNLALPEQGGTLFNLPRVNAITNTGTALDLVSLPPMERIIGRPVNLPTGASASGELTRPKSGPNGIRGAIIDQLGHSDLTTVLY